MLGDWNALTNAVRSSIESAANAAEQVVSAARAHDSLVPASNDNAPFSIIHSATHDSNLNEFRNTSSNFDLNELGADVLMEKVKLLEEHVKVLIQESQNKDDSIKELEKEITTAFMRVNELEDSEKLLQNHIFSLENQTSEPQPANVPSTTIDLCLNCELLKETIKSLESTVSQISSELSETREKINSCEMNNASSNENISSAQFEQLRQELKIQAEEERQMILQRAKDKFENLKQHIIVLSEAKDQAAAESDILKFELENLKLENSTLKHDLKQAQCSMAAIEENEQLLQQKLEDATLSATNVLSSPVDDNFVQNLNDRIHFLEEQLDIQTEAAAEAISAVTKAVNRAVSNTECIAVSLENLKSDHVEIVSKTEDLYVDELKAQIELLSEDNQNLNIQVTNLMGEIEILNVSKMELTQTISKLQSCLNDQAGELGQTTTALTELKKSISLADGLHETAGTDQPEINAEILRLTEMNKMLTEDVSQVKIQAEEEKQLLKQKVRERFDMMKEQLLVVTSEKEQAMANKSDLELKITELEEKLNNLLIKNVSSSSLLEEQTMMMTQAHNLAIDSEPQKTLEVEFVALEEKLNQLTVQLTDSKLQLAHVENDRLEAEAKIQHLTVLLETKSTAPVIISESDPTKIAELSALVESLKLESTAQSSGWEELKLSYESKLIEATKTISTLENSVARLTSELEATNAQSEAMRHNLMNKAKERFEQLKQQLLTVSEERDQNAQTINHLQDSKDALISHLKVLESQASSENAAFSEKLEKADASQRKLELIILRAREVIQRLTQPPEMADIMELIQRRQSTNSNPSNIIKLTVESSPLPYSNDDDDEHSNSHTTSPFSFSDNTDYWVLLDTSHSSSHGQASENASPNIISCGDDIIDAAATHPVSSWWRLSELPAEIEQVASMPVTVQKTAMKIREKAAKSVAICREEAAIEISEFKTAKTAAEGKFNELSQQFAAYKAKVQSVLRQAVVGEEESSNLRSSFEEMKTKLDSAQASIALLKDEQEKSIIRGLSHEETVKRLQSSLQTAQAENENFQRTLNEVKSQHAEQERLLINDLMEARAEVARLGRIGILSTGNPISFNSRRPTMPALMTNIDSIGGASTTAAGGMGVVNNADFNSDSESLKEQIRVKEQLILALESKIKQLEQLQLPTPSPLPDSNIQKSNNQIEDDNLINGDHHSSISDVDDDLNDDDGAMFFEGFASGNSIRTGHQNSSHSAVPASNQIEGSDGILMLSQGSLWDSLRRIKREKKALETRLTEGKQEIETLKAKIQTLLNGGAETASSTRRHGTFGAFHQAGLSGVTASINNAVNGSLSTSGLSESRPVSAPTFGVPPSNLEYLCNVLLKFIECCPDGSSECESLVKVLMSLIKVSDSEQNKILASRKKRNQMGLNTAAGDGIGSGNKTGIFGIFGR